MNGCAIMQILFSLTFNIAQISLHQPPFISCTLKKIIKRKIKDGLK